MGMDFEFKTGTKSVNKGIYGINIQNSEKL